LSYAFNIPFLENRKLERIIDLVKKDVELQTFWRCSNVTAINRMSYTDHGPTHAKIVANSALKLLRILIKHGVVPSVVKDYNLANEDAEVIVVLASILHDLGMIVTRERHEEFSVTFAFHFLSRYLNEIYSEEEAAVVCSEVLHAILTHIPGHQVLTVEAGIVRIADALDMEQGRARIPFHIGKVDIHAVSAMAIEKVEIVEGTDKPVIIRIRMSNSAGIFQIDELLRARITGSDLEKYIHVEAEIVGEKERKIIDKFEI
jgi:metal-dependent HD superfamily phosphatase/phosphodiesterase